MNNQISSLPDAWEPLAEAFREELQECAHLLTLLEDQQRSMMERRFVDAGSHDREITQQLLRLQQLRANSKTLYATFTDGGNLANDRGSWDRFLETLPVAVRELFRALRQEMQRQFRRTQSLSRENIALMNSAREAYGELLKRVVPTSEKPAYDARGRSYQGFKVGARSITQIA